MCYDPLYSDSVRELGEESHTKFGRGELHGKWGLESVWFNEYEVIDQPMAIAYLACEFSEGTGVLMGLAYPNMGAFGYAPMFDHLMEMHLFNQNIFSFWFSLNE